MGPKDAKTIVLDILIDQVIDFRRQVEELMYDGKKMVEAKVVTDSLATVESVASTKQVERRQLRNVVQAVQQNLEWKEVHKLCWVQDEYNVAVVLTKERRGKIGLDELMGANKLPYLRKEYNCVTFEDGEFKITGWHLCEKLTPKQKIST